MERSDQRLKKGARETGNHKELAQHAHGGGREKRRGGELCRHHNGINAGGRKRDASSIGRGFSQAALKLQETFHERSASLFPRSFRIEGEEKVLFRVLAFFIVVASCFSREREGGGALERESKSARGKESIHAYAYITK